MSEDLNALSRTIGAAPGRSTRQVGAAIGRGVDRIAADIRREGESRGYSGEVRSRRERSGPPAGFVFAEGWGYFGSTFGSATWGPDDFVTPAFERHIGDIIDDIADSAARGVL